MSASLYIGGTELLDPVALLERVGVRAGMHVADLGCGVTGHYVIPAARMVGSEGRSYAVDIQKSVLAAVEGRAKLERLANVEYVWSDVERVGATRIDPETLDVVLVINTLYLTKERANVMREAMRLAKPGGTIVVIEWKTNATAVGPAVAQRIGDSVVRAAATAAGCTEREAFEAGPYHYGLVFVKPN
jgi:ubiquinone/menaquinone biosynthesis C-methylase UbiE